MAIENKREGVPTPVKVAGAVGVGVGLGAAALAAWGVYSMSRPDRFREDYEERQSGANTSVGWKKDVTVSGLVELSTLVVVGETVQTAIDGFKAGKKVLGIALDCVKGASDEIKAFNHTALSSSAFDTELR